MTELIKKYIIELFAIVLVFVNIFFHVLPEVPLTLFLVSLSLFRTGAVEAFVLASYAAPKVLGFVLYLYNITGVAAVIELLLFAICLFLWLGKRSIKFYNFKEGLCYLLLIFLIFVLSSFISVGGDFAIIKIRDTFIAGIVSFFAYSFLFSNYKQCDFIRIGLYLILYSLLLLLISPLLNHGAGPDDIMDFGYLRQQNINSLASEDFTISYHFIGSVATLGGGMILLHSLSNKLNLLFTFICIFICVVISLYSGARQFMITSVALFVIWLLSLRKKNTSGLLYSVIGLSLVALLVAFLFSGEGMLHSVQDEGYMEASGRSVYLLKGVRDFMENPITGVGYGRFEVLGDYGSYPHNMFVEMLCELGILGTFLLLLIIIKPLGYLIKYQIPCIYIFVVYFLRSMTSGGLDSNIVLFSYVFAVLSLKGASRCNNVLISTHNE